MPSPESEYVEVVEEIAPEEQERNALDAFLSVDPNRPKETLRLKIASLNTTITVRELDEVEIDEIFSRYQEDGRTNRLKRNQRAAGRKKRDIEINADLVAQALVDPDLTNPEVAERFHDKFGTGYSVPRILKNVMKPLELQRVAAMVLALSGADEEAVTEAGS